KTDEGFHQLEKGEIQMKKKMASLAALSVLALSVFTGCSSAPTEAKEKKEEQPIIIQGPMPIEAEKFAGKLEHVKEETSGSFVFYKGTL
ncbi:hypothetical protein R0J91_17160, partial [Micrococcus sp. SIMBA_131]